MSSGLFQDVRLEVAQATSIESDLGTFFDHEFSQIKKRYPARNPYSSIATGWPGHGLIQVLVDKAHPLFIVAFTLCRYVSLSKIRKTVFAHY